MLAGDLSAQPVRHAVLNLPRRDLSRLTHVPGLSTEILEVISRSPFEEIDSVCEALAWAIGDARQVSVTTHDHRQAPYVLQFDLEGWDNEPLMSPGRIPADSWGNIPPAEVFCCPRPDGTSGSICINGSIPNYVFARDEEVILHFDGGKLVNWEGAVGSTAVTFFEAQKASASVRGDSNWNTIAEFGIGANPAITALTGNSLFDEKAIGTIHVAIGSNEVWDHDLKSGIHADLVTWHPSIRSDGVDLMVDGELRRDELAHVRASHQATVDLGLLEGRLFVDEARAESVDGRLFRRLSKAKRCGRVSVSNPAVSTALADVYEEVVSHGSVIGRDFLRTHPVWRADRGSPRNPRALSHRQRGSSSR